MPHGPRPSQRARWLLIFFGAAVPALLIGLGLFGLGDLEGAARANVEREAAGRARSLQALWRQSLEEPLPPAAPTHEVSVPSAPMLLGEALEPKMPPPQVARLQQMAAVAQLLGGEEAASYESYFAAIEAAPEIAGTAFVHMMRAWAKRAASDPGASMADVAEAFLELGAPVPDGAAVEQTSARLLALLAAAKFLPHSLIELEAQRFEMALAKGEAPMPRPMDRVGLNDGHWVLIPDPWWGAIGRLGTERLGPAGVNCAELLQHETRLGRAVRESRQDDVASAPVGRWTLIQGGSKKDPFLGIRPADDGSVRLALLTPAAIEHRLGSLIADEEGFRPTLSTDSSTAAKSLTAAFPLAGFRGGEVPRVSLSHRDVDSAIRPFTRRLQALRIGLVGVAVLLSCASLLSWIALGRDARLRALRSTFVASVSHDLRTPVASIGLLADNMKAGFAKGSEEVYVESLQAETARLGRLIEDLLDFGRIERGLPPRIQRGPVALEAWLTAFSQGERARCHQRGCAFDLLTETLPQSAQIDVAAMERALSNLVDNAIKHGGTESLTLRAAGDGSTLVFEVIDRGAGLSRAALRTDLFSPFERGDKAATSSGTGLGLSIVRAIAEAHGGRASLAAGSDGKGAVATLVIPISGTHAA